jgi:tRNA (guanine37-N1)-methyltransferase
VAPEERACFEVLTPIPDLPRHELVGGIAIMQDEDREGAARLLASRPSLHTVLVPVSAVEGPYRTRRFAVLAGRPTTQTTVVEYGHRFAVDLSLAYFSARLAEERQRVLAQMQRGERVLDMFAGVGPFAIVLAEKAGIVFAADINPDAVRLMIGNLCANRCANVVPVLADAARLDAVMPCRFERIVMNLPFGSVEFLDHALQLAHPGSAIHCYVLQEHEGQYRSLIEAKGCTAVQERFVRSYSPGRWHAVYDIIKER